jgi:ribonuclease-3
MIKLDEKFLPLVRKLGYTFTNPDLLYSALTHRSRGAAHNERLEFLGDSLLSFTMASELYQRFPKAREGDLTRMRALLVRGETLAEIARDLKLGDYLNLGVGEKKSGGHARDSILADALEACVGAIYLDGGLDVCKQCILTWFLDRLESLRLKTPQKDAKTRLQEYLQARRLPLPVYKILSMEGDPHEPVFKIQCNVSILEEPLIGLANTRRKAEQAAAEAALQALQDEKKPERKK